jgi:Fe-S-cluster containining protein
VEIITKDGFDFGFNPKACEECGGKCCTGESGYIWVNPLEMQKIANFLNISVDEFKKFYLIKVEYKFSIKEKKVDDGYGCIFFDETNKNCSIYDVRPHQCRTFPFWEFFKNNKKEVKKECPGIVD